MTIAHLAVLTIVLVGISIGSALAVAKKDLEVTNVYGDVVVTVYDTGEVNISWTAVNDASGNSNHDAAWATARALKCATDIMACRPDATGPR